MDKKKLTKSKSILSRKKASDLKKGGRLFSGKVTSNKMDKTIVVSVDRYREHPKYKKRYKISKKYKVDDKKNEYKKGDQVIIQECRPISKDKKWKVVKKI